MSCTSLVLYNFLQSVYITIYQIISAILYCKTFKSAQGL